MRRSSTRSDRKGPRLPTYFVCIAVVFGAFMGHLLDSLTGARWRWGMNALLWYPLAGAFAGLALGVVLEAIAHPSREDTKVVALVLLILAFLYFGYIAPR